MSSHISRFILWTGLCSVLLLSGCRKHTLDDSVSLEEKYPLVDVMLILRCNELQTKAEEATLEEQERQVNDLNLFFVHKAYPSPSAPEIRHYYFSSVDMAKHLKLTNIRLGEYRLYAVANAGKRLCNDTHAPETPTSLTDALCTTMTEADIKAMVVQKTESVLTRADNLLMSSVGTNPLNPYCDESMVIDREEGKDGLPAITINLVRRQAKVDFSYELVGAAVGKMKINRVSTSYIPLNVALFGKDGNQPSTDADFNMYVFNLVSSPNTGNMTDPITFYLPENMQGTVDTITSQLSRNAANAPAYASYLYLDGEYENDQYRFSVYFGDDMEGGNFDVNGNAYYHIHLKLGGPNPDDIRISSLKINVDPDHHFEKQLWVSDPAKNVTEADVELVCSNHFNESVMLVCSSTGAASVSEFEVYYLNDDGSLGDKLPNELSSGGFQYTILNMGNKPGVQKQKLRVKYRQTGIEGTVTTPTVMLKMVTPCGATVVHEHHLQVSPY